MAHDQLIAGVEVLTTSEQWISYLAFAAKFTRYSANNTFLIMVQRPDATRVAGFHTWKSLGRSVKKGSKGIAILCPCVRRDSVEGADSGETTTRSRIAGFRIGYVFDLADTEGEDLPDPGVTIRHPIGVAPDGMWDTLVRRVQEAGFAVHRAPEHDEALGAAWGRTHYGQRNVIVKSTADPAGACKTLAHELAHVLLHENHRYDHRGTVEVEAESVAFIVSAVWGLDTSSYSTGYLAGWSGGDVGTVTATANKVLACARTILDSDGSADEAEEQLVPA
ncbi:MAG: ArdC-like ssDNA-binding domain-containing protein [Acidimicrobiales bacterium]